MYIYMYICRFEDTAKGDQKVGGPNHLNCPMAVPLFGPPSKNDNTFKHRYMYSYHMYI